MDQNTAFTSSVRRIGAYLGWFGETIKAVESFIEKTQMNWFIRLRLKWHLRTMKKAFKAESKDLLRVKDALSEELYKTFSNGEDRTSVTDFLEMCSQVDHLVEPLFITRHEKFIPVHSMLIGVTSALSGMRRREV